MNRLQFPARPEPLTRRERRIQARRSRLPFDPRQPVTIHNPVPPAAWPVKPGAACLCVSLHNSATVEATIFSGRVLWFHPARKADHSCLVTPGAPFFRIHAGRGNGSLTMSAADVFPYTRDGYRRALDRLHVITRDGAETALGEAAERHQRARLLAKLAGRIAWRLKKGVDVGTTKP